MKRSLSRFTAWLLITSLILPPLVQAQNTNLGGSVKVDTNSAYNKSNIVTANGTSVKSNNLNTLAPKQTNTNVVQVGRIQTTTTTVHTPTVNINGDKKEGSWLFKVSRFGETSQNIPIQHDLTPPKCPPAPSLSQYLNGTDYYSKNGLKNPWPQGLDGRWTNENIEFYHNSPTLCRDQITEAGVKYVESSAKSPSTTYKAVGGIQGKKFNTTYSTSTGGMVTMRDDAQGSAECTYVGLVNGGEITRTKAKGWIDASMSFPVPPGASYRINQSGAGGKCAGSSMKFAPFASNKVMGGSYQNKSFNKNNTTSTGGIAVVRDDAQGSASCTYTGLIGGTEVVRSKAKDWIDGRMTFAIPAGSTYRINRSGSCADSWIKFLPFASSAIASSGYSNRSFNTSYSGGAGGGMVIVRDDAQGSADCTYIGSIGGTEVSRSKAKGWVDGHMAFPVPAGSSYKVNQSGPSGKCAGSWMRYIPFSYKTSTANNCTASKFYYHEDVARCQGKSSPKTKPSSDMSGCFSGAGNLVTFDGNDQIRPFHMSDSVTNRTASRCTTPASRYDSCPARVNSLQLEHKGLALSKEALSANKNSPNGFRADDGALYLHADFNEFPKNSICGESGINWDPLVQDAGQRNLEYKILVEEKAEAKQQSNLNRSAADVIILRGNIMEDTINQLVEKATHNLLHQTTSQLSQIEDNATAQTLSTLYSEVSAANFPSFNLNEFEEVEALLARKKFEDVDDIDALKKKLTDINAPRVNRKLSEYKQALQGTVTKSLTLPLGQNYDLKATEDKFLSAYNQWQIDKQENYSNIYANWIATKADIDSNTENLYEEYKVIKAALESGNLGKIIALLEDFPDGSNTADLLKDIGTSTNKHIANVQIAANSVSSSNTKIKSLKAYLQNFDAETDQFQHAQVNDLVALVDDNRDAVGNLNGDLSEEVGLIGKPATEFFNTMRGGTAETLANNQQVLIRNLENRASETQADIIEKITQEEQNQIALSVTQANITELTKNLANLMATQANNKGQDFVADKITHLKIARTTGSKKSELFFPQTTTPESGSNYKWNLNLYKFKGEDNPIFSISGKYQITLTIYDQAANQTIKTGFIEIKPAALDVNASSNCNDANKSHYANMVDTCRVSLPQFDRFGNKIRSNQNLTLTFRDQDTNGSYNLIAEQGLNYQNGLRFVNGGFAGNKHQLKWKPAGSNQKNIDIKSLLPTMTVLPWEENPSYAAGFEAENGFDMPLLLTHPNIGPRGDIQSTPITDNLDLKVTFKPWLQIGLSDKPGPASTEAWNIDINEPFPVVAQISTGSAALKLPANFKLNVTGNVPDGFALESEDLSAPGKNLEFTGVNAWQVESGQASYPATPVTTITTQSALSAQQTLEPLFIPSANYQVADSPKSPKTIITPGIPLGAFVSVVQPPVSPPSITISDAIAEEGQRLRFSFNLSEPTDRDIEVYLKATDDTATITEDYTFTQNPPLIIPAGSSSAEYSIPTANDDTVEDDETFTLSIESHQPSGALNDFSDTALATITNDDNTVYIFDGTADEGESCQIGVSLHTPAEEDVSVTVSIGGDNDSAEAGSDYLASDVSSVIPAGESSILLEIPTIQDEIAETLEQFSVEITGLQGGGITDYVTQSTCDIHDNDVQANISLLSNSNANEGDKAQITISFDQAENEEVKLRLETFDLPSDTTNTAKAGVNCSTDGTDYISRIFDVTIPEGTLAVAAPTSGIQTCEDAEIEESEAFGVRIVEVLSGTVGSTDSAGRVNILDDTPPVIPSISEISAVGGAMTAYESTPEDQIRFVVALDHPNQSGDDIVVTLELEDGTATGGADYNNNDITVTIAAGDQSGTSSPVTITDDTEVEPAETFKVKHKRTDQGVLNDTSAEGTVMIIDNDIPPNDVFIDDSSAVEETEMMDFVVRLSSPHFDKDGKQLKLIFTPTPITATSGSDFIAKEYQAVFDINDPIAYLTPVIIKNDLEVEPAETFEMSFVRVESGHAVGNTSDTAIGTILDGDNTNPPSIIISDGSAEEGNRAAFTVALDSRAHNGVTVSLGTTDITAVSPTDYRCDINELTVIFAPGAMEPQTVFCDIETDLENEADETFEVSVASIIGDIADNGDSDKATITIGNQQVVDVVVETPGVVMENEETGMVEFTVNLYDNGVPLSGALEQPVSITFEPRDLVAIGGASFFDDEVDFNSEPIQLILNAGKGEGKTSASVGVQINDDKHKEVNTAFSSSPENRQENFLMVPAIFSQMVRSATSAEGTIQDDDSFKCDDESRVYVRDGKAVEGDKMLFDIEMAESLCKGKVTLNFKTINGSAGDADYSTGTYSVEIPRYKKRPKNSEQLLISTSPDAEVEGSENFQLEFVSASPANYVTRVERKKFRKDGSLQDLGTVPIEGIIVDNDEESDTPVTPALTIEDASAVEGANMDFIVRLSEPNPDSDTLIRFSSSLNGFDAPAEANDFQANIATVSIAAGQGAGIAQVITNEDTDVEGNENLLLSYRSLSRGQLGDTNDSGVGTIVDNDQLAVTPSVVITDASAFEGDDVTFIIKLENDATGTPLLAPEGGIQFNIQTINGTARKQDNDFGEGRTVTIPPFQSQREFKISTNDDDIEESDETFSVAISSTNKPADVVTIAGVSATGTILDNDAATCDANSPDYFCCMHPSSCLSTGAKPGADIEGQIIVDKALCSGDACSSTDTEAVVLGTNNTSIDIREEITRNAYDLIRGQEADNKINIDNGILNHSQSGNKDFWDIYTDNLPDGGVTYLDGSEYSKPFFRLGVNPSNSLPSNDSNPAIVNGKHTIIINNASLNIVGDLEYGSPDSSLGVIVITSNIAEIKEARSNGQLNKNGQITVFKNVKNIVGAYFAEGSFVSNVSSNSGNGGARISANNWDSVNGPLNKQLILTGSLLTRNTLGAADLLPPKNPWGENLTGTNALSIAQTYDLNYLRRYVPDIDPATQAHLNKSDCAKVPGQSDCYSNTKSFILRIDPRLRENPPPGFSVRGITKLQ